MKFLIIFLVLIIPAELIGQDMFNNALQQLESDLEYYSEIDSKGKLYHVQAHVDEWLPNKMNKCSHHHEHLKTIDFSDVLKIKTTHVKSKVQLQDNLYLRVQIQEWTFDDAGRAKKMETELDETVRRAIECINKGGMTWWRIDNKLYVIFSRAFRLSFEFEEIKQSMNKALGNH